VTRYLVTAGLPYANGPIHFGHVAGAYLPGDVYARTLRAQGEDALYVCGTDEYGVAITINADKAGQEYGEYVKHWNGVIHSLFESLKIEFDVWSGTSQSPHHEATSQEFFRRLHANGYLEKQTTEQLYSEADEMFLADRYVEGTCYNCGFEAARGDECPQCGTWIDPLKLLNPRSKISGTTPVKKETSHWYLDIPALRDEALAEWVEQHEWKPNVAAFIKNMLKDVPKRAITRDMRWGVPVPDEIVGEEVGKVLYVWFDAPIGYISFTKEWAENQGDPELWRKYWQDPDSRLVHFIGKDNIPFHCLVFPSMLYGVKQDYVLPWHVPANEFYNLQGGKFNTSTGWYIPLDEFFQKYDAEVARFYLLSSLPETSDADFNWEDFQRIANSSLAGTIGNLATRVLKFIVKNYDGRIPALHPEHEEAQDALLFGECGTISDPAESVRAFRFRRASEELVANAAVANVFVDRMAPWALRKTDPEQAESALNTLCEWIAYIARWMSPFMPAKAQRLWSMLGQDGAVSDAGWPELPQAGSWRRLEAGTSLGEVEGLFPRIDDETIQSEIAALNERASS